jgi:hypothetical protein
MFVLVTYYSVKRDLLQCQKRPTTVSKETFCGYRELPAAGSEPPEMRRVPTVRAHLHPEQSCTGLVPLAPVCLV